jgi:adenylosuccinate synthase
VLLSGPVCAGKSTLAEKLAAEYKLVHIKTQECLRSLYPTAAPTREEFQKLGERKDRATKGAWVREALMKMFQQGAASENDIVLVDAVRIRGQVDAIRESYGRSVYHIHLTAPIDELERRYKRRRSKDLKELKSYDDVRKNSTERQVDDLGHIADVVVNTMQCTAEDVVVRAACHLGLYGREYLRLVDVLVGGEFGSEGKGQLAAYLASEYDVLVRVGGPNAGHTVYEEPDPYTFHHLPSGTRSNPIAKLILGPGAVLYIPTLQREIADCKVDVDRLAIDPQAMIITDEDRASEGQLRAVIGSTAQGVGAATARKILGRSAKAKLARDFRELSPYIKPTCRVLEDAFQRRERVLLEGTQGTGLSLHHGSYPHVTSRDTTVAGCLAEAGISPSRVRKVVMVCRTYPIRVQSPKDSTSGPMSQEISWADVAKRSGIPLRELRRTERTSTTKRRRRVGEFDWALLRKAASLNAPTDLALTFVDYLSVKNREASRFEQLTTETLRFIEEVERVSAAPVSLISTRFHSRGIVDRRSW